MSKRQIFLRGDKISIAMTHCQYHSLPIIVMLLNARVNSKSRGKLLIDDCYMAKFYIKQSRVLSSLTDCTVGKVTLCLNQGPESFS